MFCFLARRTARNVALAGLLALPLMAASTVPAEAQWRRHSGGHWHGHGGWNRGFVPGLALGLGVAGVAALATAPYYYPPPVYYAPPAYYYPPPVYYPYGGYAYPRW